MNIPILMTHNFIMKRSFFGRVLGILTFDLDVSLNLFG